MASKYSALHEKPESIQNIDYVSDFEMDSGEDIDGLLSQKGPNLRHLRSIIGTMIVLSILLVIVFVSLVTIQNGSSDSKLLVPLLPTEIVIFNNYKNFTSPTTSESNAIWMDLLGPGKGFISVKNPQQYGLPPGVSNPLMPPDTQNYGISMYHQLHCLIMIREVYWDALRGDRNLKITEDENFADQLAHVDHCFDYIRQGIMCAGDMSIEAAAIQRKEGGRQYISGMGAPHECKSWELSRKWMDANLPAK